MSSASVKEYNIARVTGTKSESNWFLCGWSKPKSEEPSQNFKKINSLRATILCFDERKKQGDFASSCDTEGRSCSLGGNKWRRDLMANERRCLFVIFQCRTLKSMHFKLWTVTKVEHKEIRYRFGFKISFHFRFFLNLFIILYIIKLEK